MELRKQESVNLHYDAEIASWEVVGTECDLPQGAILNAVQIQGIRSIYYLPVGVMHGSQILLLNNLPGSDNEQCNVAFRSPGSSSLSGWGRWQQQVLLHEEN